MVRARRSVKRSTHRYGADRSQVAELWYPDAADSTLPVVVLIHGGFWRQLYTKRLMHPFAAAIVARGWIAYNLEYRRVGSFGHGGWPATFQDVSNALDVLVDVPGADVSRVATLGHSAGGHLALWAASARRTTGASPSPRPVRVCAAVSLAGVADLEAAARRDGRGNGGPGPHGRPSGGRSRTLRAGLPCCTAPTWRPSVVDSRRRGSIGTGVAQRQLRAESTSQRRRGDALLSR